MSRQKKRSSSTPARTKRIPTIRHGDVIEENGVTLTVEFEDDKPLDAARCAARDAAMLALLRRVELRQKQGNGV